jgi:hypothetical protein
MTSCDLLRVHETKESEMTSKSDFTEEEWKLVVEGPPAAGMVVITAERGGSFRESWALAKAYGEAREQHGESELLDAIVAERPKFERGGAHSGEEIKDQGLQHLREAVEVLEGKATPAELDEYRTFVTNVATKVASAHKEHGQQVSEAERSAIEAIAAALGAAQN